MHLEGRIETISLKEPIIFLKSVGLDTAAKALHICEGLLPPAAYSTNQLLIYGY
jgi:hypothetical protein